MRFGRRLVDMVEVNGDFLKKIIQNSWNLF